MDCQCRYGGCYSPARYIPRAFKPSHTDKLDGMARMLADATHAGDLKIRRLRGAVWFTLDGTVFEVKVSHTA